MDNRAWLGEFLRRRREGLSPELTGRPARSRSRTPGLRREEVAELANVSATYYERLEQGRGSRPSVTVLTALSAVLRLTADEQAHLFQLAGHAVPPVAGEPEEAAEPGLAELLQAISDTTPAAITDNLGTVLEQNWLSVTLLGRFAGLPGLTANLVWQWFTSPAWRFRLEPPEQHEQTGLAYVSDLRAVTARRGNDAPAAQLVTSLVEASPEFRRMWDQHKVAALHCPKKVIDDDRVGRLELTCSIVTGQRTGQRLLALRPVPDTPTAERIAMLLGHRLSTH